MTQNTRGLPAKKPIEVSAKEARALMTKYDQDRRSCKVQKLGLHKIVDALVAAGGRSTLVHRILTDKEGKYKADIGDGPIEKHIQKRCVCFGVAGKDGKPKR